MKKRLLLNKKGLSIVITTLLFVGLTIVAVGIVWMSTNTIIRQQIRSSESCYGISEKVQLDNLQTCYSGSPGNYNVRFLVKVSDIDLEGLMISISTDGTSKGYTLNRTNHTIEGLTRYPTISSVLVVPNRSQGLSYNASNLDGQIEAIEIAPIMNGQQCAVSAVITDVDNCALLA